jgi:hypothetical protein
LVNSRLSRFTASSGLLRPRGPSRPEEPLLPKLRGQVAEFLSRGYPVHLGTLIPAYQCRIAVRAPRPYLEAFRAGTASCELALGCPAAFPSPLTSRRGGFACRATLRAWTSMASKTLALAPRVTPSVITDRGGTGLSTRCPSPTLNRASA